MWAVLKHPCTPCSFFVASPSVNLRFPHWLPGPPGQLLPPSPGVKSAIGPENEHGSDDGYGPAVPGVPGERDWLSRPSLEEAPKRTATTHPPDRSTLVGPLVHRRSHPQTPAQGQPRSFALLLMKEDPARFVPVETLPTHHVCWPVLVAFPYALKMRARVFSSIPVPVPGRQGRAPLFCPCRLAHQSTAHLTADLPDVSPGNLAGYGSGSNATFWSSASIRVAACEAVLPVVTRILIPGFRSAALHTFPSQVTSTSDARVCDVPSPPCPSSSVRRR